MLSRGFAVRLAALLAMSLGLMTVFGGSLTAQDNSTTNAPAADLQLTGMVRTSGGSSVPGSTLRVIQTSTGKAWVSWTDENGKFIFPALPAGHYRVEVSQLGFAPTTREIDLYAGAQAPLDIKLDVGTLAAITAPAASENAAAAKEAPKPKPSATATANSGAPAPANQTASAATNGAPGGTSNATPSGNTASQGRRSGGAGARNGPGGGYGGPGQGGGRRAFQQVGLNAENQANADVTGEDLGATEAGSQLGQAASADAVQMIGTVAMGQTQNQMGGFPQPGEGGPDTQGAFGNGGETIPGQAAPGGAPMGGPGGGRIFVQRGGGGGRGPGGPRGGPQGIEALWGAQRVMRQRINRIHFSFYDTFGDSALNARPYSLYQANPPKISSWTESVGIQHGRAAENSAHL